MWKPSTWAGLAGQAATWVVLFGGMALVVGSSSGWDEVPWPVVAGPPLIWTAIGVWRVRRIQRSTGPTSP